MRRLKQMTCNYKEAKKKVARRHGKPGGKTGEQVTVTKPKPRGNQTRQVGPSATVCPAKSMLNMLTSYINGKESGIRHGVSVWEGEAARAAHSTIAQNAHTSWGHRPLCTMDRSTLSLRKFADAFEV